MKLILIHYLFDVIKHSFQTHKKMQSKWIIFAYFALLTFLLEFMKTELTPDELAKIKEAINVAIMNDKDADKLVMDDDDLILYEVNFEVSLERDYEFSGFNVVVHVYSGFYEEFDENGKSIDFYRFSKSELKSLSIK